LPSPATILQDLAQRIVDHGEENKTPIRLDAGKDAINLAAGSHHAPDMLDCLGFIELNKAGAGDGMDGIAGRIGNEVKMKPGQRHGALAPGTTGSTLWIDRPQQDEIHRLGAAADSCPRSESVDPVVINRP